MENNILPKHFFEENPLDEFSTALLTHFRMITQTITELSNQIEDIVVPTMEKSRLTQYQTEKENIMNLKKAEDIVLYMRKIKDPSNSNILLEKAIEFQDDIMPLVLKRVCTSGHAVFIENIAILLANAHEKYIDQLYHIFSEIRNPYARSELCIVFGVKKKVEYTELLMKQFKQIKEERPDKDYDQGPLLALNLIYGLNEK